MKHFFILIMGLTLLCVTTQAQVIKKIDPCKIYGAIYIETQNKALAQAKVFIEENESFADLVVFKQKNRLFADRSGQWFFVEDRAFADLIIFIEEVKGFADFSIFFTDHEGFAGCKQ